MAWCRPLAPALVRRSDDGLSTRGAGGAAVVGAAGRWCRWAWPCWWPCRCRTSNGWWSAGLALFGFAFAVNSSVHSYLILAYAGSEKAAEDVGFYYAANALGRFIGTLLSGLLYQWGGLLFCAGRLGGDAGRCAG